MDSSWKSVVENIENTLNDCLLKIGDTGGELEGFARQEAGASKHIAFQETIRNNLGKIEIALNKTYGQKLISSGPVYHKMKIRDHKLVLYFDHAKGLKSKDDKPLDFFELAGFDGIFFPAKAEIKGKKIVLTSFKIDNPSNARFGWEETAQPNLVNTANLPPSAFRTNNQIIKQFNP